jgi:hypothetical protein
VAKYNEYATNPPGQLAAVLLGLHTKPVYETENPTKEE